MKRKGLTVFFFSAMILAATPRAMHHFQNYVAAAQTQAQTELLHLLLSFGAPAAESQPAQQNSQTQLACATPVENRTQPAPAVKPRPAAPASNVNAVAQNRTFEFTFPVAESATAEFAKQAAKIDRSGSADVEARQVFVKASSRLVAIAPYLGRLPKSEYLKTLLREGKLDEKKAACDVQKELAALTRAGRRTAPVMQVRLAREAVQAPLAQPETPQPETGDDQHAAQDSMR
jgi:hypothetical protein